MTSPSREAVARTSNADLTMLAEIGYGWRHGDADHSLPILAEHIEDLVSEVVEGRADAARLTAQVAALTVERDKFKRRAERANQRADMAEKLKTYHRQKAEGLREDRDAARRKAEVQARRSDATQAALAAAKAEIEGLRAKALTLRDVVDDLIACPFPERFPLQPWVVVADKAESELREALNDPAIARAALTSEDQHAR